MDVELSEDRTTDTNFWNTYTEVTGRSKMAYEGAECYSAKYREGAKPSLLEQGEGHCFHTS